MTVNILIAEDNQTTSLLIIEALKEVCEDIETSTVSDGHEAIDFLRKTEKAPHLILLDLNLPKKSGIEVLDTLKRDPHLKCIPIIVLTNSKSQDDVMNAYDRHCNAYIRKPMGFDALVETLRKTSAFWFKTATLPAPSITPTD